MSFSTWATAFVDDLTVVSAAFLNQVRIDLGRAVDGNAGGTYTPSAEITIAGANGIGVSGTGKIKSGGTLQVQSGGTLQVQSGGALDVQSGSTTTLSGRVTLGNTAQSLASIEYRTDFTTIGDANADILKFKDHWVGTSAALTANRTHTLRSTGTSGGVSVVPAVGQVVCFTRRGVGAFTITIQREDTTILAVMPINQVSWAEFIWNGTQWGAVRWAGNLTTVLV